MRSKLGGLRKLLLLQGGIEVGKLGIGTYDVEFVEGEDDVVARRDVNLLMTTRDAADMHSETLGKL